MKTDSINTSQTPKPSTTQPDQPGEFSETKPDPQPQLQPQQNKADQSRREATALYGQQPIHDLPKLTNKPSEPAKTDLYFKNLDIRQEQETHSPSEAYWLAGKVVRDTIDTLCNKLNSLPKNEHYRNTHARALINAPKQLINQIKVQHNQGRDAEAIIRNLHTTLITPSTYEALTRTLPSSKKQTGQKALEQTITSTISTFLIDDPDEKQQSLTMRELKNVLAITIGTLKEGLRDKVPIDGVFSVTNNTFLIYSSMPQACAMSAKKRMNVLATEPVKSLAALIATQAINTTSTLSAESEIQIMLQSIYHAFEQACKESRSTRFFDQNIDVAARSLDKKSSASLNEVSSDIQSLSKKDSDILLELNRQDKTGNESYQHIIHRLSSLKHAQKRLFLSVEESLTREHELATTQHHSMGLKQTNDRLQTPSNRQDGSPINTSSRQKRVNINPDVQVRTIPPRSTPLKTAGHRRQHS